MKTSRPKHPDVSHGISDLCDEQAKVVEVGATVGHGSQPFDPLVELFGSLQWVLLVQAVFALLKVLNVFRQSGRYLFIKQKL